MNKKIVLEKTTNQGRFRVIEKSYFEKVYYEIQKKYWLGWSTLHDEDLECPFTFKWKSIEDINIFFKTGKILYPGTVI